MTETNRPERLDVHNASVDAELASTFHRCAQIHLPSGRRCIREEHHGDSCYFASRDEVAELRSPPPEIS